MDEFFKAIVIAFFSVMVIANSLAACVFYTIDEYAIAATHIGFAIFSLQVAKL